MFLVLALIALSALLALYIFSYGERDKAFASFPTPKNLHSVENVLNFFRSKNTLLKMLVEYHDELGDVFLLKLHPMHCGLAVVADHKIAETLSYQQPDRSSSFFYKVFADLLGWGGLFMSTGSRFKAFKTAVRQNAFKQESLDRIFSSTNSQCNKALNILESSDSTESDVGELFNKLVLDIAFESQFNYNLNTLDGSNLEYLRAFQKFFTYATRKTTNSPFTDLLPKFLLFEREVKSLKVLRTFMTNIVKDRREFLSSKDRPEVVCTLDCYLTSPICGKLLDDEELCSEMNSFIFAGHGTTKSAMTFLFYSLARHHNIQEKVYGEVRNLLGDHVENIDSEDVKELPYTEAVINETLRLYPVGSFLGRKLASEISTGGFTFPKGIEIMISPFLMGRNAKYFDDPLTFNPDRFLGLEEPPIGFIPFSTGARKCIGVKVGMKFMKVLTSKICSRFKFSLARDYGEQLDLTWNANLAPKQKILLKFEKRN